MLYVSYFLLRSRWLWQCSRSTHENKCTTCVTMRKSCVVVSKKHARKLQLQLNALIKAIKNKRSALIFDCQQRLKRVVLRTQHTMIEQQKNAKHRSMKNLLLRLKIRLVDINKTLRLMINSYRVNESLSVMLFEKFSNEKKKKENWKNHRKERRKRSNERLKRLDVMIILSIAFTKIEQIVIIRKSRYNESEDKIQSDVHCNSQTSICDSLAQERRRDAKLSYEETSIRWLIHHV